MAKPMPLPRPTLTRGPICLDPGHWSGCKAQARSRDGLLESEVALDVVAYAGRYLRVWRQEAVFTRLSQAAEVGLRERARIANAAGCSAFLSVHCNAYRDSRAHGWEAWVYDQSAGGRKLALTIAEQLDDDTVPRFLSRGIKHSGHDAPWVGRHPTVLKATRMPAVIIELGFLTNDHDAALLAERVTRIALGRALALAALQWGLS